MHRKDSAEPASVPSGGKAPHFLDMENHLRQRFGTNVLIRLRAQDRGQFLIDFNSQEEYDRIAAMIHGG